VESKSTREKQHNTDAAVTIAITVAAEAATETTEQENPEQRQPIPIQHILIAYVRWYE
jgi:hypothetical protein